MVSRSFAATQVIVSYGASKDFSCIQVTAPFTDPGGNTIQPQDLNKHCRKTTDSQKQSTNVLEFTSPAPANNDAKSNQQFDVVKGSNYRLCIVARASSSASLQATIGSSAYPSVLQPYHLTFQTNDGASYKRYCSTTSKALHGGKMNITLTRSYTGTSNSRISIVEVEKMDAATTPTPAPTPKPSK